MVILEVLSGQVPFTGIYGDVQIMKKVLKGEYPGRPQGTERGWFTNDLWGTLQTCWSRQPNDRPTVEVVLGCLIRSSAAWHPIPSCTDARFQMDFDGGLCYMVDKVPLTDLVPTSNEDLLKLGVESHLIPFIISITCQPEQSQSGSPPLTPTEADNLTEILDRVCHH